MEITPLLDEITERGYHLHYLRGPDPWEASISRKLPEQTPDGYIQAVGYGSSTLAAHALSEALDRVENDFDRLEPKCYANTLLPPPLPIPDIFAILAPKPKILITRRH